ncbi:MAG: hypothetical protein DRQ55_02165 [Planctomycetota bacterium]|nr:MAG: hypothetical protein DRQ55_02165 [Planctomycetota bacterium]
MITLPLSLREGAGRCLASQLLLLLATCTLQADAVAQRVPPIPDPAAPGIDVAAPRPAPKPDPADPPPPKGDDVPPPRGPDDESPPPDPWAPRGLALHAPGTASGYVLLAPLMSTETYLLDNDGEVVHQWPSDYGPSGCYLMDDGSLLRCGRLDELPFFHGGGIYGRIERIAPDGEVTWTYDLADESFMLHHDLELLPNGNLLAIAWQAVDPADALRAGRHPAATHEEEGLWPDMLLEIRPTPPEGGEVVWQWHAWDHIVQDFDERAERHGDVAAYPGRFDVNGDHRDERPLTEQEQRQLDDAERQMRALGYVGGDQTDEEQDRRKRPDWFHTNAVDYHAGYDLIVLSSPKWQELYVIDHSTTTEQAAGATGGRWGHGGELLWRWGNPRRYGAADDEARQLFYQHDPQWLDGSNAGAAPGLAGLADVPDLRLTLFNNGGRRPGGERSSVDELVLPFDAERGFLRFEGQPWGPPAPVWSYSDGGRFFAPFISGAQRLPNGNTFVCQGPAGRLFEVTSQGDIVWEFRNDKGGELPPPKGVDFVPPFSVFRAARYAPEHPGIVALLGEPDAPR